MGKSRMMGAGLAGASLNKVNPNLNTSGGSKKQGLAYETGVQQINNNQIKSHAQGNNRDVIFYMNQVGGVSPSLRNVQVGGVHYKSFMQSELSDIQNASKSTIISWLKELSSIQRIRKFVSKKYKGSFNHDTFKTFILKYLPRLKLLFSSGIGATGNVEDTKDPIMTLTYGGVTWNGYSQSGGSRLYLSTTDTLSSQVARKTNYINIDCTKNVTISADINISTLKAGCVFTFYLIPMIKGTDNTEDVNGNLIRYNGLAPNNQVNRVLEGGLKTLNGVYDAEYGLGYRDAQSVATTTTTTDGVFTTSEPCIEIDLFEMSLCGAQTTLHAYIDEWDKTTSSYVQTGNKIIDKKGAWQNAWGNYGAYGADGHYYQTDEFFDKASTNPPFGPGTSFKINTLETFNVSSTISVDGTTLTLITTITQGDNIITLQPSNSNVYFTGSDGNLLPELAEMQLVSALWLPWNSVGETTWLDGIDYIKPTDPDYEDSASNNYCYVKSFAQDQQVQYIDTEGQTGPTFGGPDAELNLLTNVELPPSISYSYADNMGAYNYTIAEIPAPSFSNGPIFARYNNVNIKTEELINKPNICWSLDFYFRGINNTDNNSMNFWHGFYGQSYSMAYNSSTTQYMSDVFTSTSPLINATDYYNKISVPLAYKGNTPKYFAELTGLGQTDAAQIKNISHDGNNYGYSLLNTISVTPYSPIIPTTDAEMATQIQQFNKYGVQYLSTPNLITFSTF